MSLIHWWPLNGDMYDLVGNNHLRYINNNNKLSINNSGKFEKCYERTSVGTADLLRSTTPLQVFTEESICAWIYVSQHAALSTANGVITNHDHNSNSGLGIGVYSTDGNNYYVSINAGNKSDRIHSSYWGGTNIKGAWHHVCLVSDGSKIRMYVDGKEDRAAVSYSVYSKADYLDIFNWSTGYYTQSNYRPACKVCDVRVYDHALSDAEVKELSKALAVHYTFNDVLAEPTTNIDPCKNSLTTQNFPNTSFGAITRTYGNFHGFDCVEMYLNTTYSSDVWLYMNSNPITQGAKVGDTVTRSCWMYIPSGQTKPPHFTESIEGNSSGQTFVQYDFNKCNTWQKISMTGTIKDTGTNNYLHYFMAGSGAINFKWYMRDFQMEIKDHSTPYTPTSRASMLYNETGLTQPNNITNIKLSTDTENGTYSLNCTGSTIINTPVSGNISSGVTISCWIKTPTYPTSNAIVFADYNSRLAFGFYGTQNAIIGCGDTSIGTISNIKSQWKNGWNHISVTKNGAGTVSCYLNGAKLSLSGSTNHWSSVAGYSTIGGRNSGSYSTHFTGLVDDYRMYYTCLTDNDIAELYKTKAYVTNKGDIEAHEFIEGKTQAQVTSKYCFEADEFYEEVYGGYDVLEYIESTGTQYVDTGYVATSTDYTYELDLAPTKIGGFYSYIGFMASGTTPRAGIHEYSNTFMIGANATTNSSVTPVVNERMVLKNHCKSGAQKLYKNNVQIASNTTTFNHSSNTLTTHIFGRNYSSGRNLSSIKLYEAKIYEGSTLVRHYIPVRRRSDNALGLYELLNGTFHANSGSGTFVNGPALTNKSASIYKDQHVSGRTIIEI